VNGSEQRSFFIFYILGTLLVLGIAGGVYYVWKTKQTHEAAEARGRTAALEAGPAVTVAAAARGPNLRKLLLVGEALPYNSTTLYSKVSGYLAKITVDVGDRVKAGQLIAEIQSPEIDQQIETATVALDNKRRVYQRNKDLATKGFFSEQALDTADTDVKVAESQLSELRTLSGYRVLKAPFSGVVTQRYADQGALVQNAATNQVSALPVVTIADISRLKVSVYVEQGEAPNVKRGLDAEIVDASNAERRATGKVTRTGGELDPRTRTMLTEVDFDNSKGQFVAGSFVNVSLLVPAISYVEVPATALISRDKKTLVAVVGADNRVTLHPITVASTDGKVLRVAAGLNEGEKVVLNLPTTVADGGKVNPAPAPGAPAAPAPPPSPSAKGTVSQQPSPAPVKQP
jgi:membrane fusion protein, multidrug efflux system